MWDQLWLDCDAVTMAPDTCADARAGACTGEGRLGMIRDAAIALKGGLIAWVGRRVDLPGAAADLARQSQSAEGALITPGLIDCHTHIVFGGNRAKEFSLRLAGVGYEAIARSGGGIASTVAATRAAMPDGLLDGALSRVRSLIADGVTTVEIKSGYGLTVESELTMLRVAGLVGASGLVDVRRTFLGAHALPPEFAGDPDGYIDLVCQQMIPAVAGEKLADAVDAFGESIAFTPDQVAKVFDAARRHGLPVKLHADQLSDQDGAALAARYDALSADHLEFASEAGVAAMASQARQGRGTVAVMLPGAFYTLGETRRPPIEAFRRHGVPMAVATDCNPGSSPVESLLVAMNMACTLFRMTPEEVIAGVTRNAAQALGLHDRGMIAPGMRADLAFWSVNDPAELPYRLGARPCTGRLLAGR